MTGTSPSHKERRLLARCLLESGVLIGSVDEIWTHGIPWKALPTFRECVESITLLVGGGHAVRAPFVKSCVLQSTRVGFAPFCLDEIAEFLVADGEARDYWDGQVSDDMYPHRCPFCGAAAFIGFNQVECKASCQSGG